MSARGWAGKGSTTAWRKLRAVVLDRDRGLCQLRLPGCTTRATHVDHITPKVRGGTDDPGNLRAACRTCNLRRGQGAALSPRPTGGTSWAGGDGRVAGDRTVVLVVGPPGSGKTTLAAGLGLAHLEREHYGSDHAFIAAATLAAERQDARVAVVRTCPTVADQEYWRARLAATRVIVMTTGQDECIRRCARRARPGWRGEVAAVRQWFTQRGGTGAVTMSDPSPKGGTRW